MTKNDDLITIRTFSSDMDAQVAKAHLESEGIKSLIIKDDVGGMQPNFQVTSGVNLAVNRRDQKRAKDILKSVTI